MSLIVSSYHGKSFFLALEKATEPTAKLRSTLARSPSLAPHGNQKLKSFINFYLQNSVFQFNIQKIVFDGMGWSLGNLRLICLRGARYWCWKSYVL